MLLMVLAALTVENVFLSRGMGFYEILHGAKKGKNIVAYALLLASFSVGSGVLTHWIAGWFPMMETQWFFLLAAGTILFCYLAVCIVLVMVFPKGYRRVSWCIGPAAINTVVFAVPFLAEQQQWNVWQIIGFAVGTGIAFWLIAWILAEQLPRLRHISMPAAFRGTPAVFLFLGILALALLGFVKI